MNGKLKVKNFGILKDIDITINDFTIIIGSQAQGKSLIAKLVYFFNSLEEIFISFEYKDNITESLENTLKTKFFEIFPDYFIQQLSNIEIEFYFDAENYITIDNQPQFKIKLSEKINLHLNHLFKDTNNSKRIKQNIPLMLKESNQFNFLRYSTFIPAGRSYFSNLSKSIFSLINMGIPIEKLLLKFGSDFEMVKENEITVITIKKKQANSLQNIIDELICGKFSFEKNDIWIHNNNLKVKLSDSSSGQQELLPMISVLIHKVFFNIPLKPERNLLIIEEPEAHLFPKFQYKITELFSLIYNLTKKHKYLSKNSFFITTHSPYILSAINYFIQANNTFQVLNEKDKKTAKKKVSEKLAEDKWLEFEKVSCYWITDGKAIDIMNKENRLIDANIIDDISNEIGLEFSNLLELEFDE